MAFGPIPAYGAGMDEHRPDPADESRPENTAEDSADKVGDAPLGGDETTEEQLDADNEVEQDMLKALDPDDSPA